MSRCGIRTGEAVEVCGVAVSQGMEQQVDRGGQVEEALLLQHRPRHLHRVLLALSPQDPDRRNEPCKGVTRRGAGDLSQVIGVSMVTHLLQKGVDQLVHHLPVTVIERHPAAQASFKALSEGET